MHYDANGLTIEQIQKKLYDEDPTNFRKLLKELNLHGEDPEWEKQELYNRITLKDATENNWKKAFEAKKKEKEELAA